MNALFKAELRPVDLLLMVVACVGAAVFTWQVLTFHDYQPDEPPAAYFPVVVQHLQQGKPVMKVVPWNRVADYRGEPGFTLDLPAGPLDAVCRGCRRAGDGCAHALASPGLEAPGLNCHWSVRLGRSTSGRAYGHSRCAVAE
jgi:hypothetical protein